MHRAGYACLVAALAATLTACAASTPEPTRGDASSTTATVDAVVDGDTIRVSIDGQDEGRLRLVGIDAPELNHDTGNPDCHAEQATAALTDYLAGQDVTLTIDPAQGDTDRYDRLLRFVEHDGQDIGLWLIENGHAIATDHQHHNSGHYAAAQDRAREAELGLWQC